MRAVTCSFMMLVVLSATAAEPIPRRGETSVPPIYLMHFALDAPRNAKFVDALRAAPPDILHVGHAVPLNSIFGPTADYSGFKPQLVPVSEILRRKVELRDFVNRLHEAGIAKVICYINPSILGGDHETRKGFWAFYDHWEDYEPLGIGPKPDRPPETWMQRERRSFAPWEPEPNYPLWRYQPCPSEPAWRQYQSALVRLIAECGYDGVFVDDCIMECRHDLCAQRFPEFVKARYSPEIIQRALGGELNLGRLDAGPSARSHSNLRDAATCLFWQQSVADFLAEMNRAGRAIKPDFFTVPNWGASARVRGAAARARSGKSSAVWRESSPCQLFEEDHPAGCIGPSGVISYLLQYNYGLALGVRPAILSYGTSRRQIELGYAEAAAGGGGAYVEPNASFPDIRRKWRAFFEANRDLLEGFALAAPVGLILSFDEPRYGNDEHLRQAFAVSRALYGLHIPFAAVPTDCLTARELTRHRVLFAPQVRHLSDTQLAVLKTFVRNGGRLVVDPACGTQDLLAFPRRQPPFQGLHFFKSERMLSHLRPGKGALVQISSFERVVPPREFAVVDALDIRRQDAFVARIRELGAQPVDLGADETFRRWCAALAGGDLAVTTGARDVQTVVYERLRERDGTVTVHAVRYAVPTWGGEGFDLKPAPVELVVPLPPGWTFQRARVLNPEGAPFLVEASVKAQAIRCRLPQFEFYSMLCLNLKRSPSATSVETRPSAP